MFKALRDELQHPIAGPRALRLLARQPFWDAFETMLDALGQPGLEPVAKGWLRALRNPSRRSTGNLVAAQARSILEKLERLPADVPESLRKQFAWELRIAGKRG